MPQWGDLIIYRGASWNGGYGHVSIVSSVNGSEVVVVEENWDEVTGQGLLSLTGGTLSRPANGVPSTDIYGWLRPPSPLPAPGADFGGTESIRVSGNFAGGAPDDVATLYDYGANGAKVWVWFPSSNRGNGIFVEQTPAWWDSSSAPVPQPFDAKKSKLVAGDFDGDGRADIAILYDASTASCPSHTLLIVLRSTGSAFQGSIWWDSAPNPPIGCGSYTWSRARALAGNFSGHANGMADVAVLYDNSGDADCPTQYATTLHIFQSTGSNFNNFTRAWYSFEHGGCGSYTWSRANPVAGNFTAHTNGMADVAVLYDNTGDTDCPTQSAVTLQVFQANGVTFNNFAVWWYSFQHGGCGSYTWSRAKVVSGNFSGHAGGLEDVGVLYDNSGNVDCPSSSAASLQVFVSNGATFGNPLPPWWYSVSADHSCGTFTWSLAKLVAGNFEGHLNGMSDVAVLYDYSAIYHDTTGWLVFCSTGASFLPETLWWYSGNGLFTWSLATPT